MTIEFMVIAAPRSGTAWCANWLTTDTTLCLHDPLTRWHYDALDSIQSDKTLGVACTALGLFPDFLNAHPARKLILHREPHEVKAAMGKLQIGGDFPFRNLSLITGTHVTWKAIFENPKPLYEFLLERPFDEERHRELKRMNVQPDLREPWYDTRILERLQGELRASAHG